MIKMSFCAMAFLLAAGTLQPSLAANAPESIPGATTVNSDKVIDLIEKNAALVILDNRSAADFEAGHIENAIRLIDTDIVGEESIAKFVKSKATPVLFYCNGLKCGRAAHAASKAIGWGYSNVYYFAQGLTEWKERSLPLAH